MDSLLVPSSMQRIRAFLIEMCGMKVKPWAGAEETLTALHATLVARQSCDIFWTSLRVLLETLARDLKARKSAEPGTLLDNEVLSDERYASLLDEIRAALSKQATEPQPGAFRQLAHGLTAPALGLLLLLAGVTTVGCDSSSLHGAGKSDAGMADAAVADASADGQAGQPDSTPDNSIFLKLDGITTRDLPVDPAPTRDAVSTGPDGATVTIQDIMESCNIPSETQSMVLMCLAGLRKSWSTGTAAMLAGKDCATVSAALDCRSYDQCNPSLPAEFDPMALRLCESIIIYLGVRFV